MSELERKVTSHLFPFTKTTHKTTSRYNLGHISKKERTAAENRAHIYMCMLLCIFTDHRTKECHQKTWQPRPHLKIFAIPKLFVHFWPKYAASALCLQSTRFCSISLYWNKYHNTFWNTHTSSVCSICSNHKYKIWRGNIHR